MRAEEGKYKGLGWRQLASAEKATRRREPWKEILGGREERVGAATSIASRVNGGVDLLEISGDDRDVATMTEASSADELRQ